MEFEEKAINIIASILGVGGGTDMSTPKLNSWCNQFLINHPVHSDVSLTQQEIDSWFEALEEFRNYHISLGANDMYVKPIDYTLLPTTLLNLWKLSDCEY
jgi:hypothetical protein